MTAIINGQNCCKLDWCFLFFLRTKIFCALLWYATLLLTFHRGLAWYLTFLVLYQVLLNKCTCMKEVNSGKYLSIMGMINMKWKFDWEDLRRQFINIPLNLRFIESWSYLGVALGCIINRSYVETRFFPFFSFAPRLPEELNFNHASLYSIPCILKNQTLRRNIDYWTNLLLSDEKCQGFGVHLHFFLFRTRFSRTINFLTASNVNI